MPVATERGIEPGPNNIHGQLRSCDPTAHAKHIGIVVFPAHPSGKGFMTEGGPDSPITVGGHGHADTGAADKNATFTCSTCYLLTDGKGELRLIHGFGGITTHVDNFVLFFLEKGQDHLFQLPASMIAAHCNFHSSLLAQ